MTLPLTYYLAIGAYFIIGFAIACYFLWLKATEPKLVCYNGCDNLAMAIALILWLFGLACMILIPYFFAKMLPMLPPNI